MIDDVLSFLLDRLNKELPRDSGGDPREKLFSFVGRDNQGDAVSFPSDAMSMLLIRIEEDTTLRQPDRYARASGDGSRQRVEPEIRMNLWVLFVARFADYVQALHHLSRVIRYLQNHRVFNRENSPDLKKDLQQVILELVSLSFSEQNEIWGALRAGYLPSALYRAKLIVFRDQDPRSLTATTELIRTVTQASSL